MSDPQWIIVGAGFTGATLAERIASGLGETVLLIDRRDHIAGNAYDHVHEESGNLVHRYGPHIFHTNSRTIWDYLSRFTEWRPYFHRVLGMVDGCLVPIPFNLNSIQAVFPARLADRIIDALLSRYGFGVKVPILKLRQEPDEWLRFLADYVYQKVFERYTFKQWGLRPEDLDPGVTARVPIFISRDDRYFQDIYQAMPLAGYTAMFRKMLDHPRISVQLGTEWHEISECFPTSRIVFTGAIDEFFDYELGALPYRSLRFHSSVDVTGVGMPTGTINYPTEFDFTRVTDQRHLNGALNDTPVLTFEYPEAHALGENERYYPIPSPQNAMLLQAYRARANALAPRVFFAGRLGDYAYYNMDQACARALSLFDKRIAGGVSQVEVAE